jgi:hypothetical protein
MKQTIFLIIFIFFITAVNVFCQEETDFQQEVEDTYQYEAPLAETQVQQQQVQQSQTVQYSGNQNITLLTWELVNLIQSSGKSLNELNFFVSKSFTMLISEQYDPPKVEIQNGTLMMPERGRTPTLVFTSNQPGRLHGFPVSGSTDIFEVVFQVSGRDIALKFKKSRQNYFELFSAVIDTRPYTLHSDTELVQLAISSNISASGEKEVQAFPYSGGRSGLVEGKGSLEKSRIIVYIKKQNSSLNDSFLNKLIDTYIEESAFENINHDLAIAQMLFTTNCLKNKSISSHNYAGLKELPSWNGKFATMTEGVRAHIQHLKGYASVTMNNPQIVDPRYYLLINLKYLGTVKTFDQLYARWTADSASYKKYIEFRLDGLFSQ